MADQAGCVILHPMESKAEDLLEITRVVNAYARALDARDWSALDRVFAPDVKMDFGMWQAENRGEGVKYMREFLDGCGRTQHLLGTHDISIDGDHAASRVYVRAFHQGRGDARTTTYEMGGEYQDELQRTADGWRITARRLNVLFQAGDPSILGPG